MSAPEKARPVGFDFRPRRRIAVDDGQMRGIDRRFAGRAFAPCGDDGAEICAELRFDEQLGEGRMRHVLRLRRQHQFGVGSDFDRAGTAAAVADRDATDLGIVFGRDDHLHRRGQRAVAADEFGPIFLEAHRVVVRLKSHRLEAGRPDRSALDVAQEDVGAGVVAGGVLPPPRDGEIAPAAIARPGRGQHRGEPAVGQEIDFGLCLMRAGERASSGRLQIPLCGTGLRFGGIGTRDQHIPRHAFLQQEFRCLHHGFGVEPRPHDAVQQRVGDGDDRHALVVGHESLDHHDVDTLGQALRRVVERLVEAVASASAGGHQPDQVVGRGLRIDHRGEHRGIGCDHLTAAQSALQAEARDAETRILIGQFDVAGVVGGFRDAPRQAETFRIGDLAAHGQCGRLLQQAPLRRAHDERRHQVFEHRTRPGDQHRAMRNRRYHTAEPEPVASGNVALGNGDEAGEPGFRGKQVIATGIEHAVIDQIADRQQLARRFEQEFEIHRHGHRASRGLQRLDPLVQCQARRLVERQIRHLGGDHGATGLGPEHHVGRGSMALLECERAGHVENGLRTGNHDGEERGKVRIGHGFAHLIDQCGKICIQFGPGDRLSVATIAQTRCGLAAEVQRVGNARQDLRGGQRAIAPVGERIGKRDQMASQIAAVDRGYVAWNERVQVEKIVPVVEMPAEFGQRGHRRHRCFQTPDRIARCDPTEVAGAGDREKIEAEIGRRGAVGDDRDRILLEIVRRQHVDRLGHEGLEITPRASGGQSEETGISDRKAQIAGGFGAETDPARHQR